MTGPFMELAGKPASGPCKQVKWANLHMQGEEGVAAEQLQQRGRCGP